MVLKLFTTFIVVAAILASPKHRDFTWSYRSSIYRVHWYKGTLLSIYRVHWYRLVVADMLTFFIYNTLNLSGWHCLLARL